MIGSIRGKVILKTDKFLVVETGGVGYKINATPETISQTKDEAFLWTYTHVREDAIDLYGFRDRDNLGFFEMLLGVPSIGPRSALAILGIATLETLRKAISTGDTNYLTKVSGIGRKTAEKIVVELRDKIGDEKGISLEGELDVLEALRSLGYSREEARAALKKVKNAGDTNSKIREALKILGGRNSS